MQSLRSLLTYIVGAPGNHWFYEYLQCLLRISSMSTDWILNGFKELVRQNHSYNDLIDIKFYHTLSSFIS